MHGHDLTTLYEYIDPQHLPADFGGFQPPMEHDTVVKLFEEELAPWNQAQSGDSVYSLKHYWIVCWV